MKEKQSKYIVLEKGIEEVKNKIRMLEMAVRPHGKETAKVISALEKYKEFFLKEYALILRKPKLEHQDIKHSFGMCIGYGEGLREELKNELKNNVLEKFIDLVTGVANFFIKLVTLGNKQDFFTQSAKQIGDKTIKEMNKALEKLVKETKEYTEEPEENKRAQPKAQ